MKKQESSNRRAGPGGVLLFLLALGASAADLPDVGLYEPLLKKHVLQDGTVRYRALRGEIAGLERFVQQMGAVSPDSHPALFPSAGHRLAYWINSYNALVLWAFAKDYPAGKDRLSGLIGRGKFFYSLKFEVGGRRRSLNDIENHSIRSSGDPRIHFAIVCASTGCPWLAREAFTAENLDTLLEARARLFLSQERNLRVDEKRQEVTLSKIFDWFEKDFGPDKAAVLRFVSRYVRRPDLGQQRWKVRYFEYDWSLNAARE
ncbi:MAG: DUF547 domain-containing protein [Bryobacteraceae bacterium]